MKATVEGAGGRDLRNALLSTCGASVLAYCSLLCDFRVNLEGESVLHSCILYGLHAGEPFGLWTSVRSEY